MRVSKIRVNQIRVNQGLGVHDLSKEQTLYLDDTGNVHLLLL